MMQYAKNNPTAYTFQINHGPISYFDTFNQCRVCQKLPKRVINGNQ